MLCLNYHMNLILSQIKIGLISFNDLLLQTIATEWLDDMELTVEQKEVYPLVSLGL